MSSLSPKYVKEICESMYPLRSELVPCFIGAPGIGKTQGVYEFAKGKGVNVVTFILSNTVPSEISGIRMPDKDTKKLEVFDDSRMASLKDGDILFFDEILEASPMLWSACLTLIQDRIMASGRKLPDVFIVAASNPVTSPAIIPASTRDRFMFFDIKFDSDDWRSWFRKKHHVIPTHTLISRIQDDSDQYNILTPRTVEKLFLWMKDNKNNWSLKEVLIASMFDSIITNELKIMINRVPSDIDQLLFALDDIEAIDAYTKDVIETRGVPLRDVLEILMADSHWPEIEKALSNIEYIKEE